MNRLFRMYDGSSVELDACLHPIVYTYYYKNWRHFEMNEIHSHSWMEIMYVSNGECRIELEDSVINLKKNEFVLVGHGVPHRLIVKQSCRMLNLEFGFVRRQGVNLQGELLGLAARDEHALQRLISCPHSHVALRDPGQVHQSLQHILLELDRSGIQGNLMVAMLMTQLMIHMSRLHASAASSRTRNEQHYVQKALEFIHSHYDSDIQVGDVAAGIHLHPHYLQRIFKRSTGRTMIEELTRVRMDKSKMLLQSTNIPVIDISEYVGIGSRQYFHALFKRHTGLTPLAYRESRENQAWNTSQ